LFKLYTPAADGLFHYVGRMLDLCLRKGKGSVVDFKGQL